MISQLKSSFASSLGDIREAWAKRNIALTFGWEDIARRYRRSRVGAMWLTLNMGIMILALAIMFGTLFQTSLVEFLPHVAVGLIFWGYISHVLNEGATAFSGSDGIILQVKMPFFTHIQRVWWRNTIILMHNLVIYVLVMLYYMKNPGADHILVALAGFGLLCVNLLWMALFLAVICARFRDMGQIVVNILQVMFYATPIMWMPQNLPDHALSFLDFNVFYHLLSIVREPLLGRMPMMESWYVAIGMAVVGWIITLAFFGRYRWRIPYWL